MKKEDFKKRYKLPEAPGVYFFLDKKHAGKRLPDKKSVLYIGKATILKDRVGSYFSQDLVKTRGSRIQSMVENAKDIFYIETTSVLEAIILEAKYIKEYQPFFNVKSKDNTSYSYVIFTKEDYPRVLIKRGRELEKDPNLKYTKKFGPFTSKAELMEVMKFIRRLFPYRDKCKVGDVRPCFNYQLGLCPGTCVGAITKTEYKKNLREIEKILSGQIKSLLKNLEREMKSLAMAERFEEAKAIRDKIYRFQTIQDLDFIKNNSLEATKGLGLRLESYDISHISGTARVGVMVVLEDGEFAKSEYRKFKLEQNKNNDLAGLTEVLERRFKHSEWPLPNILVIDGGKTHLEFIARQLKTILGPEKLSQIKLFSVVKDEKHKAREVLAKSPVDKGKYDKLIILANEETHRFAINYHKLLRNKIKKS